MSTIQLSIKGNYMITLMKTMIIFDDYRVVQSIYEDIFLKFSKFKIISETFFDKYIFYKKNKKT